MSTKTGLLTCLTLAAALLATSAEAGISTKDAKRKSVKGRGGQSNAETKVIEKSEQHVSGLYCYASNSGATAAELMGASVGGGSSVGGMFCKYGGGAHPDDWTDELTDASGNKIITRHDIVDVSFRVVDPGPFTSTNGFEIQMMPTCSTLSPSEKCDIVLVYEPKKSGENFTGKIVFEITGKMSGKPEKKYTSGFLVKTSSE